MEPAGLALGTVALAALFNNVVQDFEYVRLGADFGNKFQTSSIKLANAQLRLSRWGAAIGLDGDELNDTTASDLDRRLRETFDDRSVRKATAALGQVLRLFDKAHDMSASYAATHDMMADTTQPDEPLSQRMRQLSLSRQNHTSLKKKVKWSLFGVKEFQSLITDIVDLVDDLENLFQRTDGARRQLALQEAEVLTEPESLPSLEEAMQESDGFDDDILRQAIASLQKTGGDSRMVNNFSGTNYGIQAGRQEFSGGTFNFGKKD